MNDDAIITLYLNRSEQAIQETADKYEAFCLSIASRILGNQEDARECVNETWLKAWNSIPPQIPRVLPAFLGSIARNLAISRYRRESALKRGSLGLTVPLEELAQCVDGKTSVEDTVLHTLLKEALNRFLGGLKQEERKIFVRRYYYMESLKEISEGMGRKESYVKTSLHRTREKLRDYLKKEGLSE